MAATSTSSFDRFSPLLWLGMLSALVLSVVILVLVVRCIWLYCSIYRAQGELPEASESVAGNYGSMLQPSPLAEAAESKHVEQMLLCASPVSAESEAAWVKRIWTSGVLDGAHAAPEVEVEEERKAQTEKTDVELTHSPIEANAEEEGEHAEELNVTTEL